MLPQVISGARALVSLNGTPYAAGYVLDYSFDTSTYPIHSVDDPLPQELVPDKISVSMSVRIFRTPDNDPVQQKLALPADPAGITSVDLGYTQFRYITVELRDSVTDAVILYVPRAMVTRRSGSVASEGLLSETLSLTGIGFRSLTLQTGVANALSSL